MHHRGLSLIEVVVAMGIFVILFGGIYGAYFSILNVVASSDVRTTSNVILNRQVEIIRNLPYDQVGVVGGVPSGVLQATVTVTSSINATFSVQTNVRNIDDPFDGTLGGTPNDTAPADYKLVELTLGCTSCAHFTPVILTTTVAPKNLESSSNNGSLFVNVFDGNAEGVQGATVHVVNASVTPAIDLTDVTNNNGILQLVGVPTSTQRYHITISKSGYSLDQTYTPGALGSSTPSKADATVSAQTLTPTSFSIDKVSTVTVRSSDKVCTLIGSQSFSIQGSKLIGVSPDVLKFSTSSATPGSGIKTFNNIEWDTYIMTYGGSRDLLGTIPLSPFIVSPSSTQDFRFVLTPAAPDSLLVTVRDAASSSPIFGATVTLTKGGFSSTETTGHALWTETDWSGGGYTSVNGIDVGSPAGTLTLTQSGGVYSTSSPGTLISDTFDVGSSTSSYYTLSFNDLLPAQTTIQFQVASNNDQATWNFVGPDGTASTYYSSSGQTLAATHTNNRYIRYKVYLSTQDETVTPQLNDVTIDWNSVCVPPAQMLFQNLSSGTYTLQVSASGYTTATSSVSVSGAWQQTDVAL